MTNEQIAEAQQLREQGLSFRDIEKKLGPDVSKSAIERALKADPSTVNDTPAPAFGKRPATAESVELGKLDLTLTHERKMAELEIRKEELALQRRQTELDAEKTENEKRLLRIREQQFEQEQRAEEDKLASFKEMLVGKLNRLVRELLKNCQDSTWSGDDVDEYIERVKALKTQIGRFCDKHAFDEDGLAIWHHLAALLKLVEQTKESNTAWFGSNVSFDFDKKQVKQVKAWLIKDFDDEYVKPTKKADDEDDEDDDDQADEEDDENGLERFEQEKELVGTFNELVAELADNCEATEWSTMEYDDYLTRIETYREELIDYTNTFDKPFDTEHQAITVNTDELLEFVTERTAIIKESDSVLTLYVNVEDKQWLESLPVDEFWEEIVE